MMTSLYDYSPYFLQNVWLSLYGFRLRRREYGKSFELMLREFEKMEWWSAAELENYQNEQLTRLIGHCYQNVPYYREVMDDHRLKPSDITTVADLPKLPMLTPEIIRTRSLDLISHTVKQSDLIHGHTSGTTGSPLQFFYDHRTCIAKNVVDWRQKHWANISLKDKIGVFLGRVVVPTSQNRPPFWRSNIAMNQLWFSTFHMNEENLSHYAGKLKSSGCVAIEAYPSTAHIMASFLIKNKQTVPLRAVLTSSETLHPQQRADIEQAFRCRVFDYYGLAERVIFATECREHEGHHLNPDYGITEVIKGDNEPAAHGEMGRIVATGLYNYAMPLIRYRTSDVTSLSGRDCSCGRKFPLMEDVTTKAEDIVVSVDGRHISPSILTHPFKALRGVAESQVLQEERDRIVIKIVRQSNYSDESTLILLREFKQRVGEGMNVEIQFVTSIPRTKSGKFRWVISKVPLEF